MPPWSFPEGLDCNEVCNVYCSLQLVGGEPQPATGRVKFHGISSSIRDCGCPFAMASSAAFIQAKGSTPFILQVAMTEAARAQ